MISLYTESHRVCEITRMLIRPQCTVFDVINNYLKRDSMENKQRSGRPKLVTIRDYRKFGRDINAQFNENRNTPVSVTTIQHHLHKN